MSRRTLSFAGPVTVLLSAWIALGCASAPSPTAVATAVAQPSAAPASDADAEPSDSPGVVEFSGTVDDVVAEVTDAGLTCVPAPASKGFQVNDCDSQSGGNRFSVTVYSRENGDVAGVDMTITLADPTDEDTLMSFVAFGLGGAMGPDAFNAVNDEITTRLDGSTPAPVWVSPDLRLTVRASGSSLFVTVLAADLAAVWGS